MLMMSLLMAMLMAMLIISVLMAMFMAMLSIFMLILMGIMDKMIMKIVRFLSEIDVCIDVDVVHVDCSYEGCVDPENFRFILQRIAKI